MLLRDLADTSRDVAATRARSRKLEALAAALARLEPDELRPGVAMLAGELPEGRIGVGYATTFGLDVPPATGPTLTVAEVAAALRELAVARGGGSQRARERILGALLGRATLEEQHFLKRLLVGELRQGALAGLMLEAVGRAAHVEPALLRRAQMLRNDLPVVAEAARRGGAPALQSFRLQLFQPLAPMLAQPAAGVDVALADLEQAGFEYKLDGARLQAHKQDDVVRLYTREGNEVTASAPEVVELVRALPARTLVLDGEALALRPDGRPDTFQMSMRRFGKRGAELRDALPLSSFFFDLLHADGDDLLDVPARERWQALDALVPERARVPRLVTAAPEAAESFYAQALAAGHEGLLAKAPASPYEAGRRGGAWLKLKPAHTLDLVVLAAEWGNGRRQGWLSNLHLGARDPAHGGYVMLGKTFKGLTDAVLAWQTEQLLERELGRDGVTVHVRPELVVEIAFDGVQDSPHYPGGLALRFARVKGYRPDKAASAADTIDTVRAIRAGEVRSTRG